MTQDCKECKKGFEITTEDQGFYRKIDVPPPTLCPECRYQRRLANRNEWNLYKRTCDLCGDEMVSIYNPDYPGLVYCQPCFWGDEWDAMEYGHEFDFSRPFFEQYKEFRFTVPRVALTYGKSVNCEYTNQSQDNKNCYMIVASNLSEDCLYGNWYRTSKQCMDCYNIEGCELVYQSLNAVNCYQSSFLENCFDCSSSHFLKDCRGCESCFGCVGLRNKSYCFLNEQLSKEDYDKKLANFSWTRKNIKEMEGRLREQAKRFPQKYYQGRNIVRSTGDYMEDVKNAKDVFNCKHAEDIRYCQDAWNAKTEMDLTETAFTELDYELEGCVVARCMVMSKSWDTHDSQYSEICFNSNNLFGCQSLRKKRYCIFNKQYDKESFGKLRTRIISHMKETGEWGEFFPMEISPFAYNESVAQDYFPLSKKEVLRNGLRWYDRSTRDYKVTLPYNNLPKTLRETDNSILKETISCTTQDSEERKRTHLSCATAFRIVPAELSFYKKMGLPIPDICFPCRLVDRLGKRNPRHLWHRRCMCLSPEKGYENTSEHFHGNEQCPNEFETNFAPERPDIVYCEECYNAEVV